MKKRVQSKPLVFREGEHVRDKSEDLPSVNPNPCSGSSIDRFMKKLLTICLFGFALNAAKGQGYALHVNDTLGEFLLNTLQITDKRVKEPVYGFHVDSVDINRYKSSGIGSLITRQGLALVNAYGSVGSVNAIRVAGLPADYVSVNWNGLQLNSTSLGMTDLSLIPILFTDQIVLTERPQSMGQQDLALGNNLNLISKCYRGKWIAFNQSASSLGNTTLGMVVNGGNGSWSANVRGFIQNCQNKFTYQDQLQWNKPWVEQENNNAHAKGAMLNLGYHGKKRLTSLHAFSVFRQVNLPSPMGGLEQSSNSQYDQQLKFSLVNSGPYKELKGKRISELEWMLGGALDKQNFQSNVVNSTISNQSAFASIHHHNKGEKLTFHSSASFTSDYILYQDWNKRVHFQSVRCNEHVVFNASRNLFLLNLNAQVRTSKHTGMSGELQWSFFNQNLVVEASVHHKERLPDANELYWQPGGNLNLKKEAASGLSTGLKWSRSGIQTAKAPQLELQWSARADAIEDWIQWVPNGSGIWTPQNVKEVRYAQSKFRVKYEKEKWKVLFFAEPIFSKGRNQSNQAWFQTTYSPKWRSGSNLELNCLGLRWVLEAQAIGKRYTDEENSEVFALPTTAYFNFELGRTFETKQSEWDCFIRIENITNAQFSFVRAYALPGRVFSIQINYKIKQKTK